MIITVNTTMMLFPSFPGMSKLLASISWIILAHNTNDESEMGIRVYQRPASNDIYELRTSKNPPFCKEDEKPDLAWYNFLCFLLFFRKYSLYPFIYLMHVEREIVRSGFLWVLSLRN